MGRRVRISYDMRNPPVKRNSKGETSSDIQGHSVLYYQINKVHFVDVQEVMPRDAAFIALSHHLK